MALKVGINGFGRIGRAAFKIIQTVPELEVGAINDLVPTDNLAYLLKYDTVYGRYPGTVEVEGDTLIVDGVRYPVSHEREPAQIPWEEHGVELVIESTGVFNTTEAARKHLEAGARTVLLSAPAKDDMATLVYGVNKLEPEENIVSCASCTTNSVAPVVEILDRHFGVEKAILTTIHAYTSSQAIVDSPAKKWNRGRAGAANFVPTTTGAAIATAKALPAVDGKFDGVAVRGPVPVGSLSDLTFVLGRETTEEEVNDIFRQEVATEQYDEILAVAEDPIVSSDIIGDAHASIIDLNMTKVVGGNLVKVMAWYDNEWGYTSQMVREARRFARQKEQAERFVTERSR
ncbi:MAG: type I glyceraldehyde-3-phosphate dehydrogenase [Anaerolineae bacterium]|nr:type I glyceraldehyde-3-phosphate dehydrogenase [Anaerolineae bacterium]